MKRESRCMKRESCWWTAFKYIGTLFLGGCFGVANSWVSEPLWPESPFEPNQPISFEFTTLANGCANKSSVRDVFEFFGAADSIEFPNGAQDTVICADQTLHSISDDLADNLAQQFPGCFWVDRHIKKRLYLRHDHAAVCETKHRVQNSRFVPTKDGTGINLCLGNIASAAARKSGLGVSTRAAPCQPDSIIQYGFN